MFNSLKDRLNSAVSSGMVPKLEEAKKKLSGEEGERSPNGASPTEPKSEVDGGEAEGNGPVNQTPPTSNSNAAADQRVSLDSGGDLGEERNNGEISEELKKKLEKLKKYEIKYPELAKAYKFQLAKLKSLDQVLQTWTPVQTHADHDDLENYLKNMVSQTAMITSEFKAISQQKNGTLVLSWLTNSNVELETKANELQTSLDAASAQLSELQSGKKEENPSISELLQKFKAQITSTELSNQDEDVRNGLSELATSVFQGLGHNEFEEKARDAALALKEARAQLDSLSQAHRSTLEELHRLRHNPSSPSVDGLEEKYANLCQLFPAGEDPVSSLKTHLKGLADSKADLEKKYSIQNGIVTSLKQALEAKELNVTALTSPPSTFSKPGGGKKKKKKGSSTQSPKSPSVEPQAAAQSDAMEFNRLQKLVEDQKGELDEISNKLEETKATLTKVQTQFHSQATDYSRTSSELTDLTSRHKALEHAYSELQVSQKEKDFEASKKLEAAAQLGIQLKEISNQLEEARDESKKHQETVARLNKRTFQLDKDIKAKEAALTYSKRQCSLLEQEKKDIEAELTSLQKQVKHLNADSKKKEEDLATFQAELKSLKAESEACKARLAEAESKSQQLKQTRETEEASAKSLTEENIRLKEQAESAVKSKDEAQKKLDCQVQSLTDLQQELNGLKQRCGVLDQELITSRQLFKEKATSLDSLHLQHVQLQQSAAEEASRLSSELQAYKDKQQLAQSQLETLQASTQDEIKAIQGKLAETQEKLEEQVALVNELSAHKEEHSGRLDSLNATLETLTATNRKYESELAQARERLERLDEVEQEIKKISQERDALSEASKLRESHLRNLNRDLKEEVKRLQRTGSFASSPPISPTDSRSTLDPHENEENQSFNVEYLRNIILKFLSDRERRLVTVLSHLLKFSPTDTRKLMETIGA